MSRTERQSGNYFFNQLKKYNPGETIYTYVDTDTPNRLNHSEWDGLMITRGHTTFIEFKKTNSTLDNCKHVVPIDRVEVKKLLSPDQYLFYLSSSKLNSVLFSTFVLVFSPNAVRLIFRVGNSDHAITIGNTAPDLYKIILTDLTQLRRRCC